MAVFTEKNGVWKPCGYPYGWMNRQDLSGRAVSGRGVSQYPPFARVSSRHFREFPNAQNVRAAAGSSGGSIRKGGGSERQS